PDEDPEVRNEKTKESEIWETVGQIRGQDRLHRPADSPKIGDLEPARPACPHCDDDYNHRPIAKLEWEKLLPADSAELPYQTEVDEVIHHQRKRECADDDPFYYGRFRPTDERRECERQRDCEKDDKKMRDAVRMEGWRGIH